MVGSRKLSNDEVEALLGGLEGEEEQTTATGQAVTPQSQAIQQTVGGLVNQPQLPIGASIEPTLQQLGVGETMTGGAITPTAPTAAPTTQVTAAQGQAAQNVASQTIGGITPTQAQSYTAQTGAATAPQIQAAQLQQLSQKVN